MPIRPACCPFSDCPSRAGAPFEYRLDGHYERGVGRRSIQRFECLACRRGFSEQTLRVDYRLKRPELLPRFFHDRVSKVTHRQSARIHACSRSTEERHFGRLREHCKAFHDKQMALMAARGGLGEVFLFDEQETFEHSRLKKPVTVPVLIERHSGFVFDCRVGALAPRGKKRGRRAAGDGAKPQVSAAAAPTAGAEPQSAVQAQVPPAPEPPPAPKPEPRRRSESRAKVKEAFERLRECSPKDKPITVLTDMKKTYGVLLRRLFGERCRHLRTISTLKRDTRNPLWHINHTLARTRDGVSRLVRRSWAASKLRQRLEGHLFLWTCYRNYVRGKTNHEPRTTPAMALGLQPLPWSVPALLELRVFPGS